MNSLFLAICIFCSIKFIDFFRVNPIILVISSTRRSIITLNGIKNIFKQNSKRTLYKLSIRFLELLIVIVVWKLHCQYLNRNNCHTCQHFVRKLNSFHNHQVVFLQHFGDKAMIHCNRLYFQTRIQALSELRLR